MTNNDLAPYIGEYVSVDINIYSQENTIQSITIGKLQYDELCDSYYVDTDDMQTGIAEFVARHVTSVEKLADNRSACIRINL